MSSEPSGLGAMVSSFGNSYNDDVMCREQGQHLPPWIPFLCPCLGLAVPPGCSWVLSGVLACLGTAAGKYLHAQVLSSCRQGTSGVMTGGLQRCWTALMSAGTWGPKTSALALLHSARTCRSVVGCPEVAGQQGGRAAERQGDQAAAGWLPAWSLTQ